MVKYNVQYNCVDKCAKNKLCVLLISPIFFILWDFYNYFIVPVSVTASLSLCTQCTCQFVAVESEDNKSTE